MKEEDQSKQPERSIYMSIEDLKAILLGFGNSFENGAKRSRVLVSNQASNRVETVIWGVLLLTVLGITVLLYSDLINNDKTSATDSNSDDIKLPARSGYFVKAEACYNNGECDDPADGALWRKLQETGSRLGLLTTTSKSPDPRILTQDTPALRFPIPLSDSELYKEAYLGSFPAGTQVYAIAEAGVDLLIYPTGYFPQAKQIYIPESSTK